MCEMNSTTDGPAVWPSDTTLELVVLPWSGWELQARW